MTSVEPTKFRFLTNELIALSRSRHPDKSSWQAVKQGILRAATYLREEAGQISAPIMLEKIEKLRCIQKKVVYDSEDASGAILEPVSGGFIIRLGKGQTNIRRRFGIAHEIGHTFFYNLEHNPPTKVLPKELSRLLGEKKEEDICNAFARELLMPKELVKDYIGNLKDRNLSMIINLAAKYVVSPEVAARRLLLDLSEFQTSIVLFRDPSLARGKTVWWFYGGRLRRYLRKEEKVILDLSTRDTNPGFWSIWLLLIKQYQLNIIRLYPILG
jgi:Zn-dependent peptidase ImmA (M78 family)